MKILIVEDEFPIALNTELQLKEKGYEVIGIANDFNSIISIITEDTPDIILMDINLQEGGNVRFVFGSIFYFKVGKK